MILALWGCGNAPYVYRKSGYLCFGSQSALKMATLPAAKTVLKVGTLQKRQRGKSVKGNDYRGLKFQSRVVSLNTEFLRYYRPMVSIYLGLGGWCFMKLN